jgi:oligopeptide transport system substrate-binding protein
MNLFKGPEMMEFQLRCTSSTACSSQGRISRLSWNFLTLTAAALSLLLTGCGKSDKTYRPTSQELRLNLYSEPPTIDPRKAIDNVSISILNLCFEGLTRIDTSGVPTLAAAEKVEVSLDKKRYTFTLRNANWSDGQPVRAQDFEATWKTTLDPSFPCEFTPDLYILKNAQSAKSKRCPMAEIGVKALDDKTLQVDLDHPVPYFLEALATHSFFPTPQHITSIYPNWIDQHYVGNGPFLMKSWKHHDTIILEKNPQYWDRDNLKLEKVTFMIVEDETTELTMYENGQLDWAGYPFSTLPTEALPSLEKKGDLHSYSIAGTYYYIFNTKEFPFTNANIRKAFSLAINRQSIVTNITQMGQRPAMGLIPPTMWKNPEAYFKDNDIIEARKLFELGLKELGTTVEQLPEITLSYNTLTSHHKIAQAIQEQWNIAFGIRVKLENKEWKVFLDELRLNKFQIARMGGLANVNDPVTFLDFYRYLSSSNNYSQWNNPQFSELLEQADLTVDESKRTHLLQEAEKVLIGDMPIAPIYFYTGTFLKKPYVNGIYLSKLNNLELKWAYVEMNDKISY